MMLCRCGHQADSHDDHGRCQSGDDDGDGYFDQCYCEGLVLRPPMPPGITVDVGPGTHTEVTLPDGTVVQLSRPITMSESGQIFLAVSTS